VTQPPGPPLSIGYHTHGTATWVILAIVVILLIMRVLWFRRGGYAGDAGHRVVRCSAGHLFTTTWIPGVSFSAVRLGSVRYQRCPVGDHWAFVRPVKETDLTDQERRDLGL